MVKFTLTRDIEAYHFKEKIMSGTVKKIIFGPNAFDDFESTQEELDAIIEEIKNHFMNMSAEELESLGDPLDDEWQNFAINIDATPKTLH